MRGGWMFCNSKLCRHESCRVLTPCGDEIELFEYFQKAERNGLFDLEFDMFAPVLNTVIAAYFGELYPDCPSFPIVTFVAFCRKCELPVPCAQVQLNKDYQDELLTRALADGAYTNEGPITLEDIQIRLAEDISQKIVEFLIQQTVSAHSVSFNPDPTTYIQ